MNNYLVLSEQENDDDFAGFVVFNAESEISTLAANLHVYINEKNSIKDIVNAINNSTEFKPFEVAAYYAYSWANRVSTDTGLDLLAVEVGIEQMRDYGAQFDTKAAFELACKFA